MDERPIVLDRWALAEEQVLSPIWGGLHRDNPQCFRKNDDTRFLQHFTRTRFLPCLAEHLIAPREGELAIALARKRTTNHQQAASERHEDNHYRGRIVILRHLHAVLPYNLLLWKPQARPK
jgi:hypothetical protein